MKPTRTLYFASIYSLCLLSQKKLQQVQGRQAATAESVPSRNTKVVIVVFAILGVVAPKSPPPPLTLNLIC